MKAAAKAAHGRDVPNTGAYVRPDAALLVTLPPAIVGPLPTRTGKLAHAALVESCVNVSVEGPVFDTQATKSSPEPVGFDVTVDGVVLEPFDEVALASTGSANCQMLLA